MMIHKYIDSISTCFNCAMFWTAFLANFGPAMPDPDGHPWPGDSHRNLRGSGGKLPRVFSRGQKFAIRMKSEFAKLNFQHLFLYSEMMALPVALLPCCLQVYNSKKELKAGQDFKLVTDYEQKVGFHSS